MREILFRGKRVDNGEWVEGYLFKCWDEVYILWGMTNGSPNMIKVIPETVGQWTGLTDKSGKKIFEGDVVDCTFCYDIGQYPRYSTKRRLVQYKIGGFAPFNNCTNDPVYIVGNIHDNPELFKENNGDPEILEANKK